MKSELPAFLKSGEAARLIPVVSESNKEKRLAAAFLSILTAIPGFAGALFSSIGLRLGPRTKIEAFTEVVFSDQPAAARDRPDGLIVVRTGRRTWSALVEVKTGRNVLAAEQLGRYAELARKFGIDALITISNQFVAKPDHNPVSLSRTLTRKVSLFHWSWMFIFTQAYLLDVDERIEDKEQIFLMKEFLRFLSHPSTGIDSFERMNKEWKDVVKSVQRGIVLKRTEKPVENTVASWHQETRDLCLILSRHLGCDVRLQLTRVHRNNANKRLADDCRRLVEEKELHAIINIPDAAAQLTVTIDLQTRNLVCAMRLEAPEDKKTTKARVNWLVRQLVETKDPDIHVRAIWPSRAPDTMAPLAVVREDPTVLQTANSKATPRYLEVVMCKDLAGKFSGSKTFIDNVEKYVVEFYDEVGQHLQAWQPRPPRPRTEKQTTDLESNQSTTSTPDASPPNV